MTLLRKRPVETPPGNQAHEPGQPGVHDVITRLRDAAGRMVPFSVSRTLLREAASTLERLDGDARHHATEVAHLTEELARVRAAPRGAGEGS